MTTGTKTTTRTADQVAALLHRDGQRFETPDGVPLEALCTARGAVVIRGQGARWASRCYRFPDRSAVVVHGDGWDVAAGPDCWCWAEAPEAGCREAHPWAAS